MPSPTFSHAHIAATTRVIVARVRSWSFIGAATPAVVAGGSSACSPAPLFVEVVGVGQSNQEATASEGLVDHLGHPLIAVH